MTKHICVVGAGSAIAKAYAVQKSTAGCQISSVFSDESVEQVVSPIDSIVTFSGRVHNSKLCQMSLDQWNDSLNANLTSVFKALKHGLPKMNDGGSVVVVGSIVGSVGGFGCCNYAAAKAGLVGLVKAASNEMLSRSIRVNLLELGYVEAGMGARLDEKAKDRILDTIPMGRFANVKEVLVAIDFLSSQTYMTGNTLTFAGGL